MTIATSLRKVARKLISDFGNTGLLYTYSSATKTENTEGDITVTNWGTGVTMVSVDGSFVLNALSLQSQGIESMSSDEKAVMDSTTIAVNDRLTLNSINYKVTQIKPVIIDDTLVVQFVSFEEVTNTTNW